MAKQKCPEFENHERWLVAFADMMTLLFALFVVLYSIANVDKEKLQKVSMSVQRAFGIPTDEATQGGAGGTTKGNSRTDGLFNKIKGNTSRDSFLTRNRREMAAIIETDMRNIESSLEERLYGTKSLPDGSNKNKDRVVFVNREADGIRVTMLARKFFKPNEDVIDPSARAILESIASAVKSTGRIVRVEGHTDNLPFSMHGETNWELSGMRAAAVLRFMVEEANFPKNQIYFAGFADTRPIASNDSRENRALNRRVDIKILYDTPSDSLPPDSATELQNDATDKANEPR